jgi:hypothetical protein
VEPNVAHSEPYLQILYKCESDLDNHSSLFCLGKEKSFMRTASAIRPKLAGHKFWPVPLRAGGGGQSYITFYTVYNFGNKLEPLSFPDAYKKEKAWR